MRPLPAPPIPLSLPHPIPQRSDQGRGISQYPHPHTPALKIANVHLTENQFQSNLSDKCKFMRFLILLHCSCVYFPSSTKCERDYKHTWPYNGLLCNASAQGQYCKSIQNLERKTYSLQWTLHVGPHVTHVAAQRTHVPATRAVCQRRRRLKQAPAVSVAHTRGRPVAPTQVSPACFYFWYYVLFIAACIIDGLRCLSATLSIRSKHRMHII